MTPTAVLVIEIYSTQNISLTQEPPVVIVYLHCPVHLSVSLALALRVVVVVEEEEEDLVDLASRLCTLFH
jgi:hypothetical protein